ncbi:hypothetical protein pipiens_010141 [Culex pipiens pipiens]|uniref:Odorant receptor n=1 Tax=Culex pipiens pipiens TaxID=38569 RepID=A0ABD1DEN3_CULPP
MDSEPGPIQRQSASKKYYFWLYVQEELGKCIKLHIEFLAKKNTIKPLLNANFLIIYYSTAVILASGVAHMSQMQTVTLYSLQILGHVLYVAFECATLTRMVNLMTEANESIGWELYNLDWPKTLECDKQFREDYRSVRQAVLTVLEVAQQPLGLNCFGFFEFTQDRFWELLNMAYNFYTFLRNFV